MPWLILPLACWNEPAGGHRNVGNPLWWWSCGWNNTSANVCKLKYWMSGSEITLGIAYYCFHYLHLVYFIVCMVVSLGETMQLPKVFDRFLQFVWCDGILQCLFFVTGFIFYSVWLLWRCFTVLVTGFHNPRLFGAKAAAPDDDFTPLISWTGVGHGRSGGTGTGRNRLAACIDIVY